MYLRLRQLKIGSSYFLWTFFLSRVNNFINNHEWISVLWKNNAKIILACEIHKQMYIDDNIIVLVR